MAVTGWLYLFAPMMSLTRLMAQKHSEDTYRVSAGHLFLLKCLIPGAHPNVTWSRGGRHNLSLPAGVEVREGLLWFLPVQTAHEGIYTCEKSSFQNASESLPVRVSVSSGECPDAAETASIPQGVSGGLPCKQSEIFKLKEKTNIRWMKECRPVQPLFENNEGFMRLPPVSEADVGKYTCLVDISVDGRKYTAARSIQLIVDNDTVFAEPQAICTENEEIKVEVGSPLTLNCSALIGPSEDESTLMYWTVDMVFIDSLGLEESWKFFHERGRVYGQSTLIIPEVRPQFLNVPIHCHIRNSVGQALCVVRLQEADLTPLYTTVALCLTCPLAFLALGAIFFFCKVDVVLAHRKLLRHFSKKQAVDGKLYDGFVSFLNANTQSSAVVATFALQILPQELEKKHGYSLYIRGRDDCPGEAIHDTVAAAIHQSHRLIIILSREAKYAADTTEERLPNTCEDQMCYEQKIGIYDALTQNDPRVILVEIDGPVDYSRLPESLRYIRRKQGALKFRTASTRTQTFNQLCSNRNFWKNLRYHMPSVPAGRHTIVV